MERPRGQRPILVEVPGVLLINEVVAAQVRWPRARWRIIKASAGSAVQRAQSTDLEVSQARQRVGSQDARSHRVVGDRDQRLRT